MPTASPKSVYLDLAARLLLYIPLTKNKTSLVLPLVGDAYEIIKDLCSQKADKEYIFPGTDTRGRWGSYDTAFRYAVIHYRTLFLTSKL